MKMMLDTTTLVMTTIGRKARARARTRTKAVVKANSLRAHSAPSAVPSSTRLRIAPCTGATTMLALAPARAILRSSKNKMVLRATSTVAMMRNTGSDPKVKAKVRKDDFLAGHAGPKARARKAVATSLGFHDHHFRPRHLRAQAILLCILFWPPATTLHTRLLPHPIPGNHLRVLPRTIELHLGSMANLFLQMSRLDFFPEEALDTGRRATAKAKAKARARTRIRATQLHHLRYTTCYSHSPCQHPAVLVLLGPHLLRQPLR